MTVRDPAGLLGRTPELDPLLALPGVRRGVERGAPHDVYRTLVLARLFGRARAHRDAIDTLLARRRLFLRPGRPPPMFTYNGVGVCPYGSAEPDEHDGTRIMTLFVTVLFVPLFPIASYLVLSQGGRRWNFFGACLSRRRCGSGTAPSPSPCAPASP